MGREDQDPGGKPSRKSVRAEEKRARNWNLDSNPVRRSFNSSRRQPGQRMASSSPEKKEKKELKSKASPRPPEVDTSRNKTRDFRLSDSEHVSPVRGRELSGIRTGRYSVVEEGYDWVVRQFNLPLAVSPVKSAKNGWGTSVEPIPEDGSASPNSRTQTRRMSLSAEMSGR